MDGDPAVESEVDGFSRFLPLPYRVAIILVAGTRRPLNITAVRLTVSRNLGLGCQLALPAPCQDRPSQHAPPVNHRFADGVIGRPNTHPIPFKTDTSSSTSPCLHIQPCHTRHPSAATLTRFILAHNTRIRPLSAFMANPSAVISLFPCNQYVIAHSAPLQSRSVPVSQNSGKDQYWRDCRSTRWQIWGHSAS